jgi:hypothetical protein
VRNAPCTGCRGCGMKQPVEFIACALLAGLVLLSICSRANEFKLNEELPEGSFRICRDVAAAEVMRNLSTSLINARRYPKSWQDLVPNYCHNGRVTLTLLELAPIPKGKSWNSAYSPDGKESCDIVYKGRKTVTPCDVVVQDATYYRAHAKLADGTFEVIAEIFPTNIYQQYAEAQKKRE